MKTLNGVVFLTLLLTGLAALIWSGQKSYGPKKGLTRLTGIVLIACSFFIFGLANLIGIRTSQVIERTGTLVGLQQHRGKSSSSHFYVSGRDGLGRRSVVIMQERT